MIVHRKDIKKQNARRKKTYFFHERSFLNKNSQRLHQLAHTKKT